MSRSSIGGLMAGMALSAAAMTAFSMMSRQNKRKVRSLAMKSGRKLTDKAGELFGK